MNFDELLIKRKSVRSFQDRPIEDEKIRQIIEAARFAPSACNEQLWHFIVIRDKAMKERLVKEAGTATIVKKAPVVIAVYYHLKHMELGLQSASAAIMSMLFKATDIGVGSLWLGASGKRDKINRLLKLSSGLYLVAFVLLGFEKGDAKSPTRRPLNEIMHWEYFKGKGLEFRHDPKFWTLEMIKDWQRYYCGKTAPGTHLDVVNQEEMSRIKKYIKGEVIDLFSYDGSYAECLPQEFTSLNLTEETSNYLLKATKKKITTLIFDGEKIPFEDNSQENISIILKVERIPKRYWKNLFDECRRVLRKGGRLIIAYRNKNSLYQIFHWLTIKLLGDDITKTAIHSYFGPFKPVSKVEKYLSGFDTKVKSFYFVPPVFKEYLDLLFQYFRSGGKAYLHRVKTNNLTTKVFSLFVDAFKLFPIFPSLKIVVANKSGGV